MLRAAVDRWYTESQKTEMAPAGSRAINSLSRGISARAAHSPKGWAAPMNTVTEDGRPVQRRRSIKGRSLGLSGLLAAALMGLTAIPAVAATWTTVPAATAGCPAPQLSQLLLPVGDPNWYTLAPGETTDNFTGAGWTLTGGARIVAVTLADGQTGSVLDLPSAQQSFHPRSERGQKQSAGPDGL